MAVYSGRLAFRSPIHQQEKHVYLARPVSLAALETFARYLTSITTADITTIGFTEIVPILSAGAGGEFTSVQSDVHIRCRESESGKVAVINIPAPQLAIFEEVEKQGFRLLTEIGKTFAAQYGLVKGCALDFEAGWLTGETGS